MAPTDIKPSGEITSGGTSGGGGGKSWEHAKGGAGSGADELATRFVESLSYDRRIYKQDIAGSQAHARMLAKVGLITPAELGRIEGGLDAIAREIAAEGDAWRGWRVELEDVHMCVEAALIEKIGDAGRKLHTGRSRNDQVALDLKLWIEDAVVSLERLFSDLGLALVELAERDGRIVMPAYTHLQRAQPIVVGGELLAWLAAFDRARARLLVLRDLNRQNPLGGGAVAGSSLPLDRAAVAEELPVGLPAANSIDATASRDAAVDFVYALAMTAMTLSRWAEQWILYASTEFGFVTLDSRYTTGSSMMPQKQNPDMLELIRGRCGNVYGSLVALLTICKGLPLAYNRDLQEDKRHVFAAFDVVTDCLAMAGRIIKTARFNAERIAGGLEAGFLDATSLAEYLVTKGVPFRTAHQVVGSLVRLCRETGLVQLSQLDLAAMKKGCQDVGVDGGVVDKELYDWLGPANVVKRYKTAGNAGLSGLETGLAAWRKRWGG
ncbi:MAG: argininosuccinate lyase [Phycisphaeraceae bacterium]|nr:argininosuccinate lyase [Phycisphaeraceae bacterium]